MEQGIQKIADPSTVGEWIGYVVAGLVTGIGALFGGRKIVQRTPKAPHVCTLDLTCVVKAINEQGEANRKQAKEHHERVTTLLSYQNERLAELRGELHGSLHR